MDLFTNFPLWAAVSAIFFAQFIKVPIHYLLERKVNWGLISSTGGMPSSHSAAVTALATGIGLESGLGSNLFAISAVFAVIVMYDAKGIRRHAGEQAAVLNKVAADLEQIKEMLQSEKVLRHVGEKRVILRLKELLGHKPIEVFFGAATGIIWCLILYFIIY